MERRAVTVNHPFLVLLALLVLSCVLVYPASSPPPHHTFSFAPMSRSLRLGSQQQQHLMDLKLTSSQEMAIGAATTNRGRPEARMDLEVNDYSPPGANDDHDPGHGTV